MKKLMFFALVISVFALAGCNRDENKPVYNAWCKLYGTNIDFTNWDTLYRENLLPGQPKKSDGSDEATGIAVGYMLGSSGRK